MPMPPVIRLTYGYCTLLWLAYTIYMWLLAITRYVCSITTIKWLENSWNSSDGIYKQNSQNDTVSWKRCVHSRMYCRHSAPELVHKLWTEIFNSSPVQVCNVLWLALSMTALQFYVVQPNICSSIHISISVSFRKVKDQDTNQCHTSLVKSGIDVIWRLMKIPQILICTKRYRSFSNYALNHLPEKKSAQVP